MLNDNELAERQKRIELETEKLTSFIESDMRSRIPALQRIVSRWEVRGGTPRDEFLMDARAYVDDMPGFQALEWVDENYYVRWVIPVLGNEAAVNLNLAFEEKRLLALEEARNKKMPGMTSSIELVQGGKGFLVYFPIFVEREFEGFLLVVFHINEWLNYVLGTSENKSIIEDLIISVELDGTVVYRQERWHDSEDEQIKAAAFTIILDHRFTVKCLPSEIMLERSSSFLPELTFIVGLLLSLLVSFVIYLYQRANWETWRTYSAKTALETEIMKHKKTEVELQDIYYRLTLATQAGNIGVWIWDIDTDKLTWNDIMYKMYDVPPDVMPTYATWRTAVCPEDLEMLENLLDMAVQGKAVFDAEFCISLAGGVVRHIRTAARVERDETGQPVRMTGVNWDITEIKDAEELLAAERRRLSDILEGTNVGTWEWNVETGAVIFNERWAEIIGYSLKELEPVSIETWKKYGHEDDLVRSGELLEKHFRKEADYYECETRMRHKNGSWVWVLDRGRVAVWTDNGKPLLMSGTHQDITVRKKAEEEIHHMANHDTLTNLPSLRLAKDRLMLTIEMARRGKKMAAVLFVDLDGFKAVNDTYGHDAGDAVLKEIARRLSSCVRETDTIARIGGDEFLGVLSELQAPENAVEIAEKILQSVSEDIFFDGIKMTVGASIGIAIYPTHGEDMESLIKQSDKAMYNIKKSGQNGYSFVN